MAHKHKPIHIREPVQANSDINVTPLVDVVLVLLIVFMVVTPLLEKDIAVRVPSSEKVEQLGTRTIHGVQAEGRRVTNTIATGEIGNDRPIEVVRETWYSSELQITLMSTTSDPRIGATTYEVTNLQRGEPSQSLFEVPAGYTTVKGNVMVRVERKESNKE